MTLNNTKMKGVFKLRMDLAHQGQNKGSGMVV